MEGQCTRTILLPCIFIELSPHNQLFFHNECLSGPYLGNYKNEIEI